MNCLFLQDLEESQQNVILQKDTPSPPQFVPAGPFKWNKEALKIYEVIRRTLLQKEQNKRKDK